MLEHRDTHFLLTLLFIIFIRGLLMKKIVLFARTMDNVITILPTIAIGKIVDDEYDDTRYFIEFEWITMAIGIALDIINDEEDYY